jgi:hypothetical protein
VHFESYSTVSDALAALGLVGQQKNPDQLVVSAQQGPVWPDRGNSFWLSYREGTWYLATWSPICYRIPKDQDVVGVSAACMEIGSSAMYRVPPEVVVSFGLNEIDHTEYDRLFSTDQK